MLMLLFWVGDERWAIAASAVESVVPLVNLQRAPDAISVGLLNYHGEMLPAVDVAAVIAEVPTPQTMSTRIAMVDMDNEAIEEATGQDWKMRQHRRLGLILDRAGETALLSERVSLPVHTPYIEALFKDAKGEIVRQLAVAPIVSQVCDRPLQGAS